MAGVLLAKVKKAENKNNEINELHIKIGKLSVENDFLSQGLKYYRQRIAQQCLKRR